MTLFTVAVIGNLCNRENTVPSVPTTMVCVWLWWRSTNHLKQHREPPWTLTAHGKFFIKKILRIFYKQWVGSHFILFIYTDMWLYAFTDFFLSVIGAPQMVRKMRKDVKPVIKIEQNGADFTFTVKTPLRTQSHSFSIGKESEVTGVDGRKIKVIWDHLI